jgi:hypothetical protein
MGRIYAPAAIGVARHVVDQCALLGRMTVPTPGHPRNARRVRSGLANATQWIRRRNTRSGEATCGLALATAAVALAPMPGHARRLVIARRTG